MSYRCSTNDQGAVRDGIGDGLELPGGLEQGGGADGGDRLPERDVVRVDDAQRVATEILHCARRGPDVQRIPRRDQNDYQIQSNILLGAVGLRPGDEFLGDFPAQVDA